MTSREDYDGGGAIDTNEFCEGILKALGPGGCPKVGASTIRGRQKERYLYYIMILIPRIPNSQKKPYYIMILVIRTLKKGSLSSETPQLLARDRESHCRTFAPPWWELRILGAVASLILWLPALDVGKACKSRWTQNLNTPPSSKGWIQVP